MIDKLIKYFVKYRDKIDHFLIAHFLMTALYLIHPFVGVGVITFIAGFKEIYDYNKKGGSVEMVDVLFTAAGGFTGFLFSYLISSSLISQILF